MAAAARREETVAWEAVAKRNQTQNNNNTSTNIPLSPPPYTTFQCTSVQTCTVTAAAAVDGTCPQHQKDRE